MSAFRVWSAGASANVTAIAGASLALAVALAIQTPSFAADAPAPITTLPLAIAVADVATDAGVHPAQDAAWIDAQIAEATRLFSTHASIRFAKSDARSIGARYAHMETRADRDALAALVKPGAINVFIVASLRDVDEADRMRKGVCWTSRGEPPSRYVIVSAIAPPSVLAHELGHYHGLPHSRVVNNVMSYDRDGGAIFFDVLQARTMRASASRYLREGVLQPVKEPPAAREP